MKIGHHVLVLLAVCFLGGLAFAASLHRIHGGLSEQTRQAGALALDEVRTQRLEDAVAQWLISCDLIFGSGSTYLIPGAREQGEVVLTLVGDLDHSFQHGEGKGLTSTDLLTRESEANASDLGKSRQKPLEKIETFAHDNLGRLDQVLAAEGPGRGGLLFGLLNELDECSPSAIEAIRRLRMDVQREHHVHDRAMASFEARAFEWTLGLSALYVLSVLVAWRVTTRRLIWPLATLTRAATAAERTAEAFELAESGPREIRQLASTLAESARENKAQLAELHASEDRFRSMFTCSNDAILVLDATEDTFVSANPRALEMLGFDEDSFATVRPSDLHPHELVELAEFRSQVRETRAGFVDHLSCRTRSGRLIPVEVSASAFSTSEGRDCMMVHVRDIEKRLEAHAEREQMLESLRVHSTEIEAQRQRLAQEVKERLRAQTRLEHEATHDALTGLPNRRWFKDCLDACVQEQQVDKEASFCVIFIDLDDFKVVNDSLGHDAGDELLIATAKRLRRSLDDLGPLSANLRTAARLGGDEFVVLLGGLEKKLDLPGFAASLQARLREPVLVGEEETGQQEIAVGASLGIAMSDPEHCEGDLLREADTAMYQAKLAGKSCFAIFDESMHDAAQARLSMENDLRKAIEADALEVYLQPVVDLHTSDICSFEALVRWFPQGPSGQGKPVSPAEFIPLAEEVGLILPLGRRVLEQSCQHLRRIDEQTGESRFTIAVNASRRQLLEPGFVEQVTEILKASGIAPNRLTLEVTETMVMSELLAMRRVLERFRELGVRIAMDDFGTGHSSLSCLHDLPLDVLKIDQAFIATLGLELHHTAIVASIITLAGHLGLKVVAEGVETPEQVAQMLALDCDYGQGYLFSRPLPIDDVLSLLLVSSSVRLSA